MAAASAEDIVRRLADKEAIRDLVHRYAHCVWRKDVDGAVALFTADGEMDTGERPAIRGRAALRAEYQQMISGPQLHPFVHNHLIELHGDSASGVCYLDLRASVNGTSMIGAGYYDDRYVRAGSEWKFRSRKLTMCYFVPLQRGWAETHERP
ncbi:MAG: nuclear transport factor 2 family protein [Deltaproteobacteria bacterium]|nr:nuclear transport factor 2 family protein [Deltaproteobacteria bacterium]